MSDKQLDVLKEIEKLKLGRLFEAACQCRPHEAPPAYGMARRLLEKGPRLLLCVREEMEINPSLPEMHLLSEILYGEPEGSPEAACGGCGREFDRSDLRCPGSLLPDVAPDDPLPEGECPECGALAYRPELLDTETEDAVHTN